MSSFALIHSGWSGQVAVANSPSGGNSSSIYYYGGEISTSPGINVWTNALLALNLATSFNTGSPPITVIRPDSGNQLSPPAVARKFLFFYFFLKHLLGRELVSGTDLRFRYSRGTLAFY